MCSPFFRAKFNALKLSRSFRSRFFLPFLVEEEKGWNSTIKYWKNIGKIHF